MTSTLREFVRPSDADAAAELLQRDDVRTAPLWVGPRAPDLPFEGVEAVVELDRLKLAYVSETGDGLVRLGASTRIQDLADAALLRSLAGGILARAAHLAAGSAMRHAASLGGALLYARAAASGSIRDGPPEIVLALLALDAEMVFHGPGATATAVPLADYLSTGVEKTAGLLVEVRFARPPAGAAGAIVRVARTPADQALVAAVAVAQARGPRVEWARVAIAAGGHAPLRLAAFEPRLAGQATTPELLDDAASAAEAAVSPRDDFRASAEYRRAMAGVVARRALAEAHHLSADTATD